MDIGSIKATAIPAGTFVLRFIPRRLAMTLAGFVADICGLFDRQRRRRVMDNLARTAPSSNHRERERLTRHTFRHFAAVWVDFLRVPLLTGGDVRDLVRWDTRRNLDAALAPGKGVVIVTAHVGALDIAGIYLAACGYPIS